MSGRKEHQFNWARRMHSFIKVADLGPFALRLFWAFNL